MPDYRCFWLQDLPDGERKDPVGYWPVPLPLVLTHLAVEVKNLRNQKLFLAYSGHYSSGPKLQLY